MKELYLKRISIRLKLDNVSNLMFKFLMVSLQFAVGKKTPAEVGL